MKSATLAACAGLALAGTVWLGSASVLGSATSPERLAAPMAALTPAVSLVSGAEGRLAPDPSRACVQALSKDICDSYLQGGDLLIGGCEGTECRTAYVRGALLTMNLVHNQQGCASGPDEGRCDEVREKDGTIEAKIDFTLRIHEPCALRGFFEGRWRLNAADGSTYDGTVTGTIGVGTHRAIQCANFSSGECERCLDVEFLPEHGGWRIGAEASFVGTRTSPGFGQEDMRFTMSADFFAKGDENGPYDLSGRDWKFEGAVDGVHVVYCD